MPMRNGGYNVGLVYLEPTSPHAVPTLVWYPTSTPEKTWMDGIYRVSGAVDAPPTEGRFPLVLISHGSGGGDVNHHDWGEALARAGFVAAAPRHIGDSHDFKNGAGSRFQLLERPLQAKASLDAVAADPRLARTVDAARAGIIGFSAGGYTALTLLGARPDFARWHDFDRKRAPEAGRSPAARNTMRVKRYAGEWPEGVADSRLAAAVLLAPFAVLFPPDELARIDVPVLVYKAADDSVTPADANADAVARALPGAKIVEVPGSHFVFIAPPRPAVRTRYPLFYEDAPGVDRTAIHARIADEMIEFFTRKLKGAE